MKKTRRRVITTRQLAASVLLKWEGFSQSRRMPLAQLTEDFLENTGPWSVRDRALVRELVFGVVRWLVLLDRHIDFQLISKKKRLSSIVRSHLRIGVFQILFLDRIPFSAAVNEAVKGVKSSNNAWASGLVNAVLRRVAERRESLGPEMARRCEDTMGLDAVERLAIETSHPRWMVNRWVGRYGLEEARSLCRANNIQAPLTLRVNTLTITREHVLNTLTDHGIDAVPGRYAPEAIMIRGYSGSPVTIPGFKHGWFQVQDEAAQLVSYCLAPKPHEIILDACAGPGGKTTHIVQLIRDHGIVEATDRNDARLELLKENQERLGIKCISCIPFESFNARLPELEGRYHRILVDAPCSGLGVIRRHPDIKWNRTRASLPESASQQKSLLNGLVPLIRPGGTMVYATCTLEPEETREVVEVFLSSHPGWHIVPAGQVLLGPAATLVDENGFLVIFPRPSGPDGFFAAILRQQTIRN
ncbi:MAG: 16S rRNA (cytosine(967)-C(5))-methyltransferase RsmB [Deltaproteobacteria bacterium]|nr:16S rRNA (cytosine(967)-C(5))-methyltransferase RsmB [Deltaproteobacteria bacterium]MBW1937887.1 16S rRNA (cytosine(967)-C(5))-methyltransferase RsmB [Deltaproteobacteria bacterium]MBW1963888.1 16S rRNA (cytosine(967)-C(5))-methyltransferase RsmB [Deltaproteobacteria bacterium]